MPPLPESPQWTPGCFLLWTLLTPWVPPWVFRFRHWVWRILDPSNRLFSGGDIWLIRVRLKVMFSGITSAVYNPQPLLIWTTNISSPPIARDSNSLAQWSRFMALGYHPCPSNGFRTPYSAVSAGCPGDETLTTLQGTPILCLALLCFSSRLLKSWRRKPTRCPGAPC